MHITRCAASLTIFALACSGAASARTTTIAELGTAPLLGSMSSTPEMRAEVAQHSVLLASAAQRLGINAGEYGKFRQAVAHGDARWVTVPRHLDAMSWRTGHRIHVIRDVMIPADTHGWQVDLDEGSRVVSLYMPARCGNLSLVVRPIQRVARLPKPLVAAAVNKPAPVAAPVAPPVEAAPPVETAPAEVAVQPTPVPRIEAPVYRATRFSPLAIIPVLFGFGHGGGGGGGTTTTTTSNSPGPGCGVPACY